MFESTERSRDDSSTSLEYSFSAKSPTRKRESTASDLSVFSHNFDAESFSFETSGHGIAPASRTPAPSLRLGKDRDSVSNTPLSSRSPSVVTIGSLASYSRKSGVPEFPDHMPLSTLPVGFSIDDGDKLLNSTPSESVLSSFSMKQSVSPLNFIKTSVDKPDANSAPSEAQAADTSMIGSIQNDTTFVPMTPSRMGSPMFTDADDAAEDTDLFGEHLTDHSTSVIVTGEEPEEISGISTSGTGTQSDVKMTAGESFTSQAAENVARLCPTDDLSLSCEHQGTRIIFPVVSVFIAFFFFFFCF
jgi:hypothetical protein